MHLGAVQLLSGGQALLPKLGDSLDTKKGSQVQHGGRRHLEATTMESLPLKKEFWLLMFVGEFSELGEGEFMERSVTRAK